MSDLHDFVVVANRLPVDRARGADGSTTWRPLPRRPRRRPRTRDAARTAARGSAGPAARTTTSSEFDSDGMHLVPVAAGRRGGRALLRGHVQRDALAALPRRHRRAGLPPHLVGRLRRGQPPVRRRRRRAQAAEGATVWVQDYQLQLVPQMLRRPRPDLRIGFFNHIPFPPYEIFAQLPWRRQVLDGLLGADLLGFQRSADAEQLPPRVRAGSGSRPAAAAVRVDARRPRRGADVEATRAVVARSFPISIDAPTLEELARRPEVLERARQIRAELGDPDTAPARRRPARLHQGHPAPAPGVRRAARRRLGSPCRAPCSSRSRRPSRERVEQYQQIRARGRGDGRPDQRQAQRHRSPRRALPAPDGRPHEELAALYLAADVMLVTALRDGMNLVAKEYVATR